MMIGFKFHEVMGKPLFGFFVVHNCPRCYHPMFSFIHASEGSMAYITIIPWLKLYNEQPGRRLSCYLIASASLCCSLLSKISCFLKISFSFNSCIVNKGNMKACSVTTKIWIQVTLLNVSLCFCKCQLFTSRACLFKCWV